MTSGRVSEQNHLTRTNAGEVMYLNDKMSQEIKSLSKVLPERTS